jgi:hypothetical protein
MADTVQVVRWALGQQCQLRQGPGWEKPGTALKALADCQTYSGLRTSSGKGFGVFGDVCVSSVTPLLPGEGLARFDYPHGGFILSSQFAAQGGLSALHQLCGNCPANVDVGGIAGCAGYFHRSLYADELQATLERLISRLGLAAKVEGIFPPAQRHWFRFWITSPMPVEGMGVLRVLFDTLHKEEEEASRQSGKTNFVQIGDLSTFVRALDCSIRTSLPLHVDLTPPGHTDLGWYTIFSHCPRCKAEAPVDRWQRKHRDEEILCAVCGENYSPATTHSAVRDKLHSTDLHAVLGQEKFEKLAVQSLTAQGASEADAVQLVQKQEEWERGRQEKWDREAAPARRHDRFVEEVIYRGLNKLRLSADEEAAWFFSAADAEEIIRRCKSYRGKVVYLSHVSESGGTDEYVRLNWFNSAAKALKKLREKGCNERFGVIVKIPPAVVEGWAKE